MVKLLLVDDDRDFLVVMSEYLKSLGFEPSLATSARQARDRLKQSRYDMVISDLNMPGESGLDLYRHVSSWYPHIPFILMTGCGELRVKREVLRKGVDAYLEKPFFLNDLMKTIAGVAEANPIVRIRFRLHKVAIPL